MPSVPEYLTKQKTPFSFFREIGVSIVYHLFIPCQAAWLLKKHIIAPTGAAPLTKVLFKLRKSFIHC